MEYVDEGFEAPLVDPEDGDIQGVLGDLEVQAPGQSPGADAEEVAEEEDDFVLDDEVGRDSSGPPPLRYDLSRDGEVLHGLPLRHDLLTADAESLKRHVRINEDISLGKPVLFMPNDIQEGIRYMNNQQHYQLTVHGVTPDGMKAQVVFMDIPVYFDVWIPPEMAATETGCGQFLMLVNGMTREFGLTKIEQGEAFPLRGYSTKPRMHLRLHFANLQARKKAIQAVRESKYETANDDRSNYFRMVARSFGLPLSSWWLLRTYVYERGGAYCTCSGVDGFAPLLNFPERKNTPLAANSFSVNIADVSPVVHPLRPSKKAEAFITKSPALARDSTLIMTLDIETHSPDKGLGTPPTPHKPNDVVFMICCTLHRYKEAKPLAQVCLTTQECAPDKRWTTVICGQGGSPMSRSRPNLTYGQDSLLMALALLWRAWAPDMYIGFNNGQYDDPFIVEKARQFGLLAQMDNIMSANPRRTSTDESIMRWNYKDRRIKVSAERSHVVNYWKINGCVPLDARVSFMRLYPKAEKTSLKYFLDKVKLGGKADMPYTRMWKIYENMVRTSDEAYDEGCVKDQSLWNDAAEQMRHVAHYCIVDALRCQEMILKKNILSENREVGNYSFTSLFDCIYYAGGHKVCNMLLAYGQMSAELLGAPIYGSMIAEKVEMKGKYPGAFVVPPEKGLEEDLPITGLDFASLYPSLIRAYNLSPDRAVFTEEEARRLEAEGKTIHRVEFPFGGDIVRGWFVRHDNDDRERGIFARALADLFNMRAEMKKDVKWLEALIEWMEAVIGDYEKLLRTANDAAHGEVDAIVPPTFLEHLKQYQTALHKEVKELKADTETKKKAKLMQKVTDELAPIVERCDAENARLAAEGKTLQVHFFEQELDDVEFKFNGINSKQKAVKVFMNTFYGEAGNSLSPIFMLALAGGVTSAGQYNLKMVARFVESKGFLIKYGDTDSLYLACPPECYKEITEEYNEAIRALGITISGDDRGPGGDDTTPPVADAAALWDAEAEVVRTSIINLVEWKRNQELQLDAMSPDAVGSPNFMANPELASAYNKVQLVYQQVGAQIMARQKALGERPVVAPSTSPTTSTSGLPAAPSENYWLRDQLNAIRANPAAGGPARADEIRKQIDAAYYDMCVKKIKITMERMTTIRDEVNTHLAEDNGTNILNMAYEEALFPVVFTGKKKYFGIPHVNKPNFNITSASKIFIRGIDVVKQGQTRLAKEVGYRSMWAATRLCPPGDRVPLIERIENVIAESCSGMGSFRAGDETAVTGVGESAWKLSDFTQTDAWKPDKDNRSVQKFMKRMRVRHKIQLSENAQRTRKGKRPKELDYIEPEPGSRFSYLIVDSGPTFSLEGYVSSGSTKGDLMEYVDVAKKHNMRIDVPYYLIHYVVGLCARFINYDDRFQPPGAEHMDSKEIDKYSQARAKTYLTKFVRGLNKESNDVSKKRSAAYKRAYKRAAQRTCETLSRHLGECSDIFTGTEGLVMKKTDNALTPQERAAHGIVNFELFLPTAAEEKPANEEFEEDEGTPPPPPTISLPERLQGAARSISELIVDAFEEPIPRVEATFASGAHGVEVAGFQAVSRPMGLSESVINRLGIDRTPEGKKRLYTVLAALQGPSRRDMRKGVPSSAIVVANAVAEIERETFEKISDAASVIERYSERVQDGLHEQVLMEREREHRERPQEIGASVENTQEEDIEPALSEAGENTESSLFECTPEELTAIKQVRDGWLQLVGIATMRTTQRLLIRRLTDMRDRGL